MKKILSFILIFVFIFSLAGCDSNEVDDVSEYTIDYSDAASFESALNDGVNVKDKIVQFYVNDYVPDSILGINCHAGEHLNFLFEDELEVKKGDTIIVRVTEEPSKAFLFGWLLGSWKVPCEFIEFATQAQENSVKEHTTEDATEELQESNITEETTEESQENNADLSLYFDEDTIAALDEIPSISAFNLSTSSFDEQCDPKPIAVLFFDLDFLEQQDAGNDYYTKINNGGCIEIFEDSSVAARRDSYLAGYFFFRDFKHGRINNYIVIVSEEVSDEDQTRIMNKIANILDPTEVDSSETVSTNDSDQKMEEESSDDISNQKSEESSKFENIAYAPDEWTNLLEKHYEDVKEQFEEAGFTNVICVAHEIDFDEDKVFEGSVVNIAVGEDGDICTFEKGEQWPEDIKIRIDYRVKPEKPDTTKIVLPQEDSKLGKDFDTQGTSTVYYINTDNISNKPSTTTWGSATVTDGVAEYLDYLKDLGFTVIVTDTTHKEPYSGYHTYETNFKISNDSVSWTMYLYIQKEQYVEYELDVHLN